MLQEEIISLIKRDDNLFMVGDVKQSIYKFRLAEPEIFKAKYSAYQKEAQSMKLDLNRNFRSKSVILAEINEIFCANIVFSPSRASYRCCVAADSVWR